MAGFSISEAYGEGVSLIMRRPLSVLVWGLVFWVLNIIPVALMFSATGADFFEMWGELMASAAAGDDPQPHIQGMQDMMNQMQAYQALGWIVGLLATGLMNAAIFRAVLRPEDGGFMGLKLGKDELWQAFIDLCVNILLFIMAIPFFLIVAGLGVAAYFAGGQDAAGGVAVLVMVLIGVILFLWLALRFSLAGPATFATSSFQLFESWTLTKGQGWRLVGLAVLLALTLLVVEIAIGLIFVAGFISLGVLESLSPEAIEDFFAQPFDAWSVQIMPWAIGLCLVGALLTGVLYTFLYAPFASVYRQLTRDTTAA